MSMVSKGFGNVSIKDLTMERKRVEEFEESLYEDYGWVKIGLARGLTESWVPTARYLNGQLSYFVL